jgi:hypothetical protein
MSRDSAIGFIGSFGLLALMLLGLVLVVRALCTGLRGSAVRLTTPVGFGRGALGRTVASLLTFAVAYRFFFSGYGGGLYSVETMLGLALLGMCAMVLIPVLETLVSLAALTVFLMDNTAVFGQTALGTFFGLLVVYSLFRWLLGR